MDAEAESKQEIKEDNFEEDKPQGFLSLARSADLNKYTISCT